MTTLTNLLVLKEHSLLGERGREKTRQEKGKVGYPRYQVPHHSQQQEEEVGRLHSHPPAVERAGLLVTG